MHGFSKGPSAMLFYYLVPMHKGAKGRRWVETDTSPAKIRQVWVFTRVAPIELIIAQVDPVEYFGTTMDEIGCIAGDSS